MLPGRLLCSSTVFFVPAMQEALPGEKRSVHFRAEFFNILNGANFGTPPSVVFFQRQRDYRKPPRAGSPPSRLRRDRFSSH